MNSNNICVFDFETGSTDPRKTQPLQLAAIMIDGRKLEIIPNSIFASYIKPIEESKCEEYGLDSVEEGALKVNKITLEQLSVAPPIDVVWPEFINYVNQYNTKKNKWTAPCRAGFNIDRFDNVIIERICGGNKQFNIECKKEPYKLGPWDDKRNESTLFDPRWIIDLRDIVAYWMENNPDIENINFDALRDFFGISKLGAHNAVGDVVITALLLIRFLKLSRRTRINFKSGFEEENKILEQILSERI